MAINKYGVVKVWLHIFQRLVVRGKKSVVVEICYRLRVDRLQTSEGQSMWSEGVQLIAERLKYCSYFQIQLNPRRSRAKN